MVAHWLHTKLRSQLPWSSNPASHTKTIPDTGPGSKKSRGRGGNPRPRQIFFFARGQGRNGTDWFEKGYNLKYNSSVSKKLRSAEEFVLENMTFVSNKEIKKDSLKIACVLFVMFFICK